MLLLQLAFLCVAFGSVQAQGKNGGSRRICSTQKHACKTIFSLYMQTDLLKASLQVVSRIQILVDPSRVWLREKDPYMYVYI